LLGRFGVRVLVKAGDDHHGRDALAVVRSRRFAP
jgi:hypothetical protein